MKADNIRYADADLIALANNGLMYLFSSLKLTLAGQMVEHVNFPVRLHHFSVWQPTHQTTQKDVDWHRDGLQTLMLMQLLLILDLQYGNAPTQTVVFNLPFR